LNIFDTLCPFLADVRYFLNFDIFYDKAMSFSTKSFLLPTRIIYTFSLEFS
jgi:hypothetical protein